jgi:ubiquinone/menaquinone biosynthesis C-methylase UbiE
MALESVKAAIRDQFNQCAHHYLASSPMADQALLSLIVRLAGPGPADHVLDVACGAGFLVREFARYAERAAGIDLSAAMLHEAEKASLALGLTNTAFQLSDGESLPFGDATFDIVSCKLALHYFPHPGQAIGEMRRVARKGARIVLVDRVSSENRDEQAYHNRIEKLRTPSKVRVYSTSEIVVMLANQGMSIDHVQQYEQYQDVDEWLATTGASEQNRLDARELLLRSLAGDLTGLKVRRIGERLTMPHTTTIIVATNNASPCL